MQFEPFHAPRNQPLRLADRLRAAHRIHAGERHHDVAVRLREVCHDVIRNLRSAGQALIDRKHDAADLAGRGNTSASASRSAGRRYRRNISSRLRGGVVRRIPIRCERACRWLQVCEVFISGNRQHSNRHKGGARIFACSVATHGDARAIGENRCRDRLDTARRERAPHPSHGSDVRPGDGG